MPDYRYHAGNWPPLEPVFSSGIDRFSQYVHDSPEMLDRAYVQLAAEPLMRPYRQTTDRLAEEPDFERGSFIAKGFRHGYTAGALVVDFAYFQKKSTDYNQLMDKMTEPSASEALQPTTLADLVIELAKRSWQEHELELRHVFDDLRNDGGAGYMRGAQRGLGYFRQRYGTAWERWRVGAIARIEAEVLESADWESIQPS